MARSLPRFLCLSVLVLAAAGCKKPHPAPPLAEEPRAVVTTHAADLSLPRPRVDRVESVDVPGDRPVLVVLGADVDGGKGRVIVHLHGRCLDPRSDLDAWSTRVSEHGTVLALAGDVDDCPEAPGMSRWGQDIAALDRRIGAAIEAVAAQKHVAFDAPGAVLVGESMGATRAMQLAHRYAGKYSQLILIGAPDQPVANDLIEVKRIALLAGAREDQSTMRVGESALAAGGIATRFWELPEAAHGEFGPEGADRMGDALRFVLGAK